MQPLYRPNLLNEKDAEARRFFRFLSLHFIGNGNGWSLSSANEMMLTIINISLILCSVLLSLICWMLIFFFALFFLIFETGSAERVEQKLNELNDKNIFIWNETKEKQILCNYIARILFVFFFFVARSFFLRFLSCHVVRSYVRCVLILWICEQH